MALNELGKNELIAFTNEWPRDRIVSLNLEEYTNSDRNSAFIYWLEKRTENTGSIWGGSAFKFGIYRRRNTESSFKSRW